VAEQTPDDHEGHDAQQANPGAAELVGDEGRATQPVPSGFGIRLTPSLWLRKRRRGPTASGVPPGET
jgi:hypothetical protein